MSQNLLCASPVQGLVVRLIKLDTCGVPITGTGSAMVVMDGFTQVQDSPQYDTGDRIITRKADGTLCQNWKVADQFTNDEITVDFCVWNPGLAYITLGARILSATSSPTGTGFAIGTWANSDPVHWSLELWQPPPQGCPAGTVYYPYHAWPHISDGKRGDMTASGTDATMLQIIGNTYDASAAWLAGNSYLGTGQVILGDHYLYNLESTAPPPDACVLQDFS